MTTLYIGSSAESVCKPDGFLIVELDCSLPPERVLLALRDEPLAVRADRPLGGRRRDRRLRAARVARRRARTRSRGWRTCRSRAATPRSAAAGSAGSATASARASRRCRRARRGRSRCRTPTSRSTTTSCGRTRRGGGGSRRSTTRPLRAARLARLLARVLARRAGRPPSRASRRARLRPRAAGRGARGRGRLRRADRRRRDLPGQPLPAARGRARRRRRRPLRAAAAAAASPATARASSRRGAGSRASRPSCSCAGAAATVTTGPIKGTAPRDGDPAALQPLGEGPRRARDDRRPDAQRPRARRRVRHASSAPEAPEAQPHAGVWHLVSEVRARLAPGHGDAALLRATFPPGSVTGAPKVQAMHVISELEATGREVYTGAIGFASPHAGLELNVAIRTFEAHAGRLWLGAGGGIVADSDPRGRARGMPRQGAPADRRDRRPTSHQGSDPLTRRHRR